MNCHFCFILIMMLAYIDPGLGALIWQTMIAAFVGFLFYLKRTRRWVVGLLQKIFGRAQKPETTTTEPAAAEAETKTIVR
jgi:hypothetical protein